MGLRLGVGPCPGRDGTDWGAGAAASEVRVLVLLLADGDKTDMPVDPQLTPASATQT